MGQHVIEHFGDELLFGAGQAGDGVELLFEAGGGTALAGQAHGGLAEKNLVERQIEQFGQAREQGRADADSPDLVMGEGLLGDAEGIGEGLLAGAALAKGG